MQEALDQKHYVFIQFIYTQRYFNCVCGTSCIHPLLVSIQSPKQYPLRQKKFNSVYASVSTYRMGKQYEIENLVQNPS